MGGWRGGTADMSQMNSRERVIMALAHREPDRLPFDCPFGYTAFDRLMRHLGHNGGAGLLPTGPDLNVRPPVEFLQDFGIDLVYVGLSGSANEPRFEYGADRYVDEWGISYRKIEGAFAFSYEAVTHPLAKASLRDLEDFPWPDSADPARIEGLEDKCRRLSDTTDLAIVGRFNTPIFEQAFMLRGLEQFLVDILDDPDFACALLDKTTDIAVGLVQAGLARAGRYLQVLRLAGDDQGHQRGTLLAPEVFRRIIKPRFARLYREAKAMMLQANPQAKLMAHTDGDVYAIIPDYIEMGLDVLNPVQPHVTHMDHGLLKEQFGATLSFHGAVDIQRLMPHGTPEEVEAEVAKTMRTLGAGGGYIVAPTHYLQADVPPENIVALRDAVMKHGRYPLPLAGSG